MAAAGAMVWPAPLRETGPMKPPASFLADPPPSSAVTAAYAEDLASDGYVFNLTRLWCWRPDVMTLFGAVRSGLLAESTLSPREIATMVVATAAARGDAYCSLAWGRKLAELTDETTAAEVLRGMDTSLTERESALVRWCRLVVRDPNSTTETDVAELRKVGFTDREVFEATCWISFRMAFSSINAALGAPPDPQLAENAPPSIQAAVTFGRPAGASADL